MLFTLTSEQTLSLVHAIRVSRDFCVVFTIALAIGCDESAASGAAGGGGGPDSGTDANGNTDGISISSGIGNEVHHCLAYLNSDDGIDTWRSIDTLVTCSIVRESGLGSGDGAFRPGVTIRFGGDEERG